MYSRLPTNEAYEKEDRIDEMKEKNNNNKQTKTAHPAPAVRTAGPALPYAKVVGRHGDGAR